MYRLAKFIIWVRIVSIIMAKDLKFRGPDKLMDALEQYKEDEACVSLAEAVRLALKREFQRKGKWE